MDAFSRAAAGGTPVAGDVVARSRSSFAPTPAADALEVVFYNLVSLSVAFLVIALIMDWVRNSYDDDEDDGGDEDEGGFDYEMLQEGDRDLLDRDGREGGGEPSPPACTLACPCRSCEDFLFRPYRGGECIVCNHRRAFIVFLE